MPYFVKSNPFLFLNEFFDAGADVLDLVLCKFGVHGEREESLGGGFGYWKITFFVAEVVIGLLQVERQGVVQAGGDAFFLQEFLELVAVFDQDDVKMIHRLGKGCLCHPNDPGYFRQQRIVAGGVGAAGLVPLCEAFEFDTEHAGLNGIQAAVVAFDHVKIFFLLAVVADHADFLIDVFIVGHDRPALAAGAQVFAGIEAEASGSAE